LRSCSAACKNKPNRLFERALARMPLGEFENTNPMGGFCVRCGTNPILRPPMVLQKRTEDPYSSALAQDAIGRF